MDVLTNLVARILYAVPFAVFGLMHFMNLEDMTGMIPGWMPFPAFWVIITGIALILAAVSILIEKKTKLACLLLGIMLLIFVLTLHLPMVVGGEMDAMQSLLKDLSLAGAAWYIAGNYSDDQ